MVEADFPGVAVAHEAFALWTFAGSEPVKRIEQPDRVLTPVAG
jgi:hypothetical protein